MNFKIGYNKLIVSLPIVLALILSGLAYKGTQQGIPVTNEQLFLIFGLVVFSAPMYFLPYIVVKENEIWVNNSFGMPRRRAKFKTLKDIRFEKGNLIIKADDYDRKLYYSKILVDARGLMKLKKMVEEDQTTKR